jgi:cob(I)alamin adenosyltransferase
MDHMDMAALALRPNLDIDLSALEDPLSRPGGDAQTPSAAFQKAEAAVLEGEFDLVILNNINPLLHSGDVPLQAVFSLLDRKPPHVEMVLSGAGAPEGLLDRADLVTEMIVSPAAEKEPAGIGPELPGPIEVITGNGKGKTTYCLGKALLRSCSGIRSAVLQFMKAPRPYGEIKAIHKLPHLAVQTMGEGFILSDSPPERQKHLRAARVAWEECLREIFSLKYGLVILDEINNATYYGLVHPERVREMLFLKPHNLEILLSGRNAHLEVRAAATTLVEMREIKHPYRKGIKARKGIEF